MNLLDVPIVPEHVWAPIKDLKDPKTDDHPGRRRQRRPVPADRVQAERVRQVQGQQGLLARRAEGRRAAAAACSRTPKPPSTPCDRARSTSSTGSTPTQFAALKGRPDIATNAAPGRRYDELNLNFGVQNSANQPDRRRQPGTQGHPAPQGDHPGHRHADARRPRGQRPRAGRRRRRARRSTGLPLGPGSERTGQVRPRRRQHRPGPGRLRQGRRRRPRRPGRREARAAPDRARQPHYDQGVSPSTFPAGSRTSASRSSRTSSPTTSCNDRTNAGKYDLAIAGYATNPDPDYALSAAHLRGRAQRPGQGRHHRHVLLRRRVRQPLAQQLTETDDAKRAGDVKQAQARLYEPGPSTSCSTTRTRSRPTAPTSSPASPSSPQPDGAILEQSGYWGVYGATPAGSQATAGLRQRRHRRVDRRRRHRRGDLRRRRGRHQPPQQDLGRPRVAAMTTPEQAAVLVDPDEHRGGTGTARFVLKKILEARRQHPAGDRAVLLPLPAAARRPGRDHGPRPRPPARNRSPSCARSLGVDKPVLVQFGQYLWDLLHGDLGDSHLLTTAARSPT